MTNLFRIANGSGAQAVLSPANAGLNFLALDFLRLDAAQEIEQTLAVEEACLVLLSGAFELTVHAPHSLRMELGPRADVFTAKPFGAYLPRGARFAVRATRASEIAVIKAPADLDLPAVAIQPDDCMYTSAGAFNWRRDIRLLLPPGSPLSQRLIVGETLNPPGNWSGIPPHKHEEISVTENLLEEFYLFSMKPTDGFGVQLVYKGAEGGGILVRHRDVFVHYNSYHPTVAAPGVTIHYLWALAGDDKAYRITTDPRFDWTPTAEAVLKERSNG